MSAAPIIRLVASLAGALALAGCTSVEITPAQTTRYRCDGGREFSITSTSSPDRLLIDIAHMQFSLNAEPASSSEQYGCGVLTLRRDGDMAQVLMEGAELYENCRRDR